MQPNFGACLSSRLTDFEIILALHCKLISDEQLEEAEVNILWANISSYK